MSNSKFKRNTPINIPTEAGKKFIDNAEDAPKQIISVTTKFSKKEFTFPLSAKHAGLLEKIYKYFDEDISRRKLGAKALAKGLEDEAEKLGITISDDELN
ncbi:hypothetical protein IB642_04220 [Allofrancisella guangzhouensis]|uniref:hypothetical protein n=1 Tax=Allofrancisella guangzhouensis TaxID=594679 RepID=UPI00190381BD|nr:hypothetical protein [Allofrancisella guangzhouensis]MBK2027415.1 hypothetical protein [Allofrancisella guangzhouensis]MBK2044224.1 hypothetical protein [Allofrancisella guangzhouensis]MBK2045694.1 hypothetical protein [Allofrancisella guangzhouensis]